VQRKSEPIAIAVLPLENLSHDPANDYFADGLTDELIRNLSLIDGLSPRSRTSSFVFKGQPLNVREVGKQLAVDYILEGSVLRAGQQLRINVQLIRVRDDFPVWSGQYAYEVTDVFMIHDEISRGVVNSLRLKLQRGRRRYETSPEAYDLYLRARAAKGGSLFISLLQEKVGLYQEAIAKDPTFAPAYAGLASTYAFRSGFGGLPELDRPDELAKMQATAAKAIQLDPLLAEAHAAQGAAYARAAQWEQSESSFRRALDIDPQSSESRDLFTMHLLLPLGRVEEAVRQMRLAERTDPLSAQVHNDLAYALRSAGRFDEAARHCEQAANRALCLSRTRLAQGRVAEAIDTLGAAVNRNASAGEPVRAYLGYAYARAGRRQEAEQIARALAPFAVQQALIFAGLGDKNRTLDALERATALGPVRLGRALATPEFALIRGDPRLKALRRRVGLPE
jgi:TolB-like protein/Flp pilus assembly protein TadD